MLTGARILAGHTRWAPVAEVHPGDVSQPQKLVLQYSVLWLALVRLFLLCQAMELWGTKFCQICFGSRLSSLRMDTRCFILNYSPRFSAEKGRYRVRIANAFKRYHVRSEAFLFLASLYYLKLDKVLSHPRLSTSYRFPFYVHSTDGYRLQLVTRSWRPAKSAISPLKLHGAWSNASQVWTSDMTRALFFSQAMQPCYRAGQVRAARHP